MKKYIVVPLLVVMFGSFLHAQQWMRSLEIAQKLALVQNKMIFMVWEESTFYDYPVVVQNKKGRYLVIPNLFSDEKISPLIWQNFVPVIVSEDKYEEHYLKIKGKRSLRYIDKFNDDSIKIMDINGNILNVGSNIEPLQNITGIIEDYALNTEFIASELRNYYTDKSFYSAYFLASKYLDLTLYTRERTRTKLIDLSNIYLEEAKELVKTENLDGKQSLLMRCELLKIQEYLLLKRPKKLLRSLKRLEKQQSLDDNEAFVAFLYYTAYMSLGKQEEAQLWKSKVSSLNLKKAEKIINLNI
ncbi:hypothetical protein [Winogradskyella alexanderae]|uniref:Uncharacterized protein n=1 Tax=Winogradskyella alexanderae TaxID=2877123 RepID=A0ABS7XVB0_9FLAO|nr:hypothetical protein [Winogradskyella alexanderae]MCA0132847.1 hypothetical protein [Winogradskyella alexanderae]